MSARAAESGRVEVPDEGTVFTVRLPARLAAAVREHARASGRTISSVAVQALEEFLVPCSRGPSGQVRQLRVETEHVFSRHAAAEMSVAYAHLGAAAAGQDRRPGGGRRRR